MTSAQDWARFYVVKRGWALTPLHYMVSPHECSCVDGVDCALNSGEPEKSKAGKHPVKGSWTDPSNMIRTEEGVAQFWATRPWNIGLPTGQINRLLVIDIDPRNGGFNSLDDFEAIRPGGPLPRTLTAHTGGGGRHLFYSLPAGVVIKKGPMHKDFPGIDIQADGAQVVLPPSLHRSGIRYMWADGRNGGEELAVLPDDMIDFLTKRSAGSGSGAGLGTGVDLDAVMRDGIPDGQRNNVLYKVACKIARQWGVDDDSKLPIIVSLVEAVNEKACRPPLPIDELPPLINSAVQFIRSDPGGIDNLPPQTRAWLEARARPGEDDGFPAPNPEDDEGGGAPEGPSPGGVAAVPARPADGDDAGVDVLQPPTSGPPDPDSLGDDRADGTRSLTDNGNARRLVDAHQQNLRFTPNVGWFKWGELHWDFDEKNLAVMEHARHLPVNITAEIDPTWTRQVQDPYIDWVKKSRSAATIRNACSLAESDPRIHVAVDAWDADDWLLGVKNGVLDLRTGQLYAGTRDQYITKKTKIMYDQTAKDYRFEKFIDSVTQGDREFADWLQLVAGYTLTGLTHHEKFFLVYGPQASGKSTFGAILAALLGDYSFEMGSDQLTDTQQKNSQEYWLAQLAGRRMVFVSEMPEAEAMKEDMVKRLTGGDRISARPIGKDIITFTNHSKLWIATNHRPRVRDDAMWRRMVAVPFMFKNLAPSADLKPHLLGEGLPAALAWAVEGAAKYARAGDFGTCSKVSEATAEYKLSEDRLGLFLEEDCTVGEGHSVPFVQLHQAYKMWEVEQSVGSARGISVPGFQTKLLDRGFTITGRGRKMQVEGVSLVLRAAPVNADGSTNFSVLAGRNWG